MTAGMSSGKMRIPTTADLMSMWNASGLKEKLIFTFGMLVLFRLGIHLPLFGVNNEYFANLASQNNILGFYYEFSHSIDAYYHLLGVAYVLQFQSYEK